MEPYSSSITEKIKQIPIDPGCYIFKDVKDRILYVGKSKRLRSRVQSYFRDKSQLSPRIILMIRQIYDIEVIVTDTEAESLTLESNLIKEHKPYFNILLKDDKKYPYVCITWSELYPRIFITRRRRNRSSKDRYYGPFVDVNMLRSTLFNIKKVFPLRQRNQPLYKDRTCLNYSIGICPGVCQEKILPEDYRDIMKRVAMVFQGRIDDLKSILIEQMNRCSEKLDYEKAANFRDQIESIDKLTEHQKMIIPDSEANRDVFSISSNNEIACIQLFQMRAGKLVGRLGFTQDIERHKQSDILQRVIEEYYSNVESVEIPKEILLPFDIDQMDLVMSWLSDIKGSKVTLINPIKGEKKSLVKLVSKNSDLELELLNKDQQKRLIALEDLTELFNITEIPRRIEAYDISHIQGSNVVASQVVFINGIPAKNHYRRYKITSSSISLGHSDDYMALSETIRRRFRKWSVIKKEGLDIKRINNVNRNAFNNDGLNDFPDIILIDGGKGQLSSVVEVLRTLGLDNEVIVCSLAKQNEDLFIPTSTDPINTTKDQEGMILLRRLRDEAHRFAVSYHRNLRSSSMSKSRLGDIPGIGRHMTKTLLNYFNSIESIQNASIEQLKLVEGLGEKKALQIWNYFHQVKNKTNSDKLFSN